MFRRSLLTDDGVRIEAAYNGKTAGEDGVAVVLAHGFTGALDRPALRRAAEVLAETEGVGGVVTFSFRGHGRSGGASTVGDREVYDVDAAVRWAREIGHRQVATVGFSMGGSVVLRHAARGSLVDLRGGRSGVWRLRSQGGGGKRRGGGAPGRSLGESLTDGNAASSPSPGGLGVPPGARARDAAEIYQTPPEPGTGGAVDAVVSVSAPARWYYRGTAPMRRVHWAITRPVGRLVARYGLRTRIQGAGWDPVPLSPVEAVPYIAPTPLLIVHGDRDGYFPLDHPLSLARAAGDAAELWIEPGFGHAENAADPDLLRRVGAWLTGSVSRQGSGGAPRRADVG